MRGREFYWKALYSFSKDKDEHDKFYEKSKIAYMNVFRRVGLENNTYLTFASGGTFSKFSHEFQTISDAGEDIIFVEKNKGIAINKEVMNDEVLKELNLDRNNLTEEKAIEVGNIFSLGFKFSEPLDLNYKDQNGEVKSVYMGSYGIGITRLMGTIVEVFADEKGIVWPESVAPFKIHLLSLSKDKESEVYKNAKNIYYKLIENNIEVLFDDRENKSAGEKFSDADLIGIPLRVVISDKSLEKGGVEVKKRNETEGKIISVEEFLEEYK